MLNEQSLRTIFESEYKRNEWYKILRQNFGAEKLREPASDISDRIKGNSYNAKAYELGSFETPVGQLVGLYEVQVQNAQLYRNRRALRDLLDKIYRTDVDAALVVFIQGGKWRFTYVSEITVRDGNGKREQKVTDPKRYTYLFGEGEKALTAARQFSRIKPSEYLSAKGVTLVALQEAFNVDKMSKAFFNEYRRHYGAFTAYLTGEDENGKKVGKASTFLKSIFYDDKKEARDFVKKMLGRIVFLYFLEKKGWLGVPVDDAWGKGDENFLSNLFKRSKELYKNDFYSSVLEPLFFNALNTDRTDKNDVFRLASGESFRIPFLNGGLFEENKEKRIGLEFPEERFEKLFEFFDRYNFTVYEDSPDEHTVAVDPEMLGHIFENLLEDNKDKGAYYTPKEIVHYMCQESLIEYLYTKLNPATPDSFQELGKTQTEMFGNDEKKGQLALIQKHEEAKEIISREALGSFIKQGVAGPILDYEEAILTALYTVKVCDPAIGSGAFPMGVLMEIFHAVETMYEASTAVTKKIWNLKNQDWVSNRATVKLNIIQNSIYGVDIENGAVDIARLRFWLSLVVDEDNPKPLPNLDYKIVQGNSLLGVPLNTVVNVNEKETLEKLKEQYFSINTLEQKTSLKQKITETTLRILETANQYSSYKIDFDFDLFFSEVFPNNKGGFDIVIGNPPYVGQKGHKELFQEIKKTDLGKKYHQRRMDLFYFFFHLGLLKLKQKGVLAFITTNYFLTATYSDKLRKHLFEDATILSLINFNELKVFESAQGQHNVITILLKGKYNSIKANTIITQRRGLANEELLYSLLHRKDHLTSYYTQNQNDLFEKDTLYIRIEPDKNVIDKKEDKPNIQSILDNIRKSSEPLGTFIDITTGIQSSSDKVTDAFLKKYPDLTLGKGEGIYLLTNKELKEKRFSNEDLKFIKKTYKNSEAKKWTFLPDNNLNVIYIKSNGKSSEISHGIKSHLDRYKLILVNRNVRAGKVTLKDYEDFVAGRKVISYIMNASAMKNGNYYCLSYARGGKDTFEVPKIINPRRAKFNVFAYEDKGYYEQSDMVVSTLKKKYYDKVSLKYLLAIINSKLILHWLYYKGKRKGDMLELFQKPISEIPIKVAKSQEPFIDKVNSILAIKQNDPNADISQIEKEVNVMVYHLYELSYEDASIIENDSNWISKEAYEGSRFERRLEIA